MCASGNTIERQGAAFGLFLENDGAASSLDRVGDRARQHVRLRQYAYGDLDRYTERNNQAMHGRAVGVPLALREPRAGWQIVPWRCPDS